MSISPEFKGGPGADVIPFPGSWQSRPGAFLYVEVAEASLEALNKSPDTAPKLCLVPDPEQAFATWRDRLQKFGKTIGRGFYGSHKAW